MSQRSSSTEGFKKAASLIAKRKPFRQLEDFNVGADDDSDEYVREYHKRMEQQGRGGNEHYGHGPGPGGPPQQHWNNSPQHQQGGR